MTETRSLRLSWSVSRGRDTYGYNICRLDDEATGKRYRCMGGGYDMVGTVFGEWLQEVHQDRLRAIGSQAYQRTDDGHEGLYGMASRPDGAVRLDGACGEESMLRIARAAGVTVQTTHDRRGSRTGYVVTS